MSDINQPCPTICSACGRTSGKCQSCIKVDAVLTPERIESILRKCASNMPGLEISEVFARAISREVVAILARRPLTEGEIEKGRDATFSIRNPFCPCDSKTMLKAVRWAEHAHGIVSTPAASGIGESGGE